MRVLLNILLLIGSIALIWLGRKLDDLPTRYIETDSIRWRKGNPLLGTGNGIGGVFIKGYRRAMGVGDVYYNFLSFIVPIIPIGCFLAEEGVYNYKSHHSSTQSYKVYGSVKWNLIELLSIYLRYVCILGGIFALIGSIDGIIENW